MNNISKTITLVFIGVSVYTLSAPCVKRPWSRHKCFCESYKDSAKHYPSEVTLKDHSIHCKTTH